MTLIGNAWKTNGSKITDYNYGWTLFLSAVL